MEQFEALWVYQTEDIKADVIANEIKRSPARQKLEKSRDFILEKQKQYKQIEDEISAMVDRKDIIGDAVRKLEEQLSVLQDRFDNNPPQSEEEIRSLLTEVSKCRDSIRQYEAEMSRIVNETVAHDKLQRSVRLEAAKAKQAFDQQKLDYESESKVKKAELDQQRARVKALVDKVDPALLEEYNTIKRHITPPVARLTYGQCSGCNTALPSATLSKIKSGVIVECETCGRMIIQ